MHDKTPKTQMSTTKKNKKTKTTTTKNKNKNPLKTQNVVRQNVEDKKLRTTNCRRDKMSTRQEIEPPKFDDENAE